MDVTWWQLVLVIFAIAVLLRFFGGALMGDVSDQIEKLADTTSEFHEAFLEAFKAWTSQNDYHAKRQRKLAHKAARKIAAAIDELVEYESLEADDHRKEGFFDSDTVEDLLQSALKTAGHADRVDTLLLMARRYELAGQQELAAAYSHYARLLKGDQIASVQAA